YLPPVNTAHKSPSHPTRPQNIHTVSLTEEQDEGSRKRPKYTRSKTGCITCRIKKVKCDEIKPDCNRCRLGNKDCTWPDLNTLKKR
ncbi:hypothetical protein FA15DRAFT_549433, partial [Coprinopsis marcescibilis]